MLKNVKMPKKHLQTLYKNIYVAFVKMFQEISCCKKRVNYTQGQFKVHCYVSMFIKIIGLY